MTDNKEKLILEAYRLSEARLGSQASLAIAADARAMSFAGLCLAAASILTGLGATTTGFESAFLGATLLVFSSILAWYSARPINFYVVGSKFSDFDGDIAGGVNFSESVAENGAFNDKHIKYNTVVLDNNASMFSTAFLVAILAIFITIVFAFLPQICGQD